MLKMQYILDFKQNRNTIAQMARLQQQLEKSEKAE